MGNLTEELYSKTEKNNLISGTDSLSVSNPISIDFNVQKRIREILFQSNISAYSLSKLCDVPRSTVSRWLNSDHKMTLHSLEIVCRGIDISLSDFFSDDFMQESDNNFDCKFMSTWKKLSTTQKQEALDYINYLLKKTVY